MRQIETYKTSHIKVTYCSCLKINLLVLQCFRCCFEKTFIGHNFGTAAKFLHLVYLPLETHIAGLNISNRDLLARIGWMQSLNVGISSSIYISRSRDLKCYSLPIGKICDHAAGTKASQKHVFTLQKKQYFSLDSDGI